MANEMNVVRFTAQPELTYNSQFRIAQLNSTQRTEYGIWQKKRAEHRNELK